MKCYLSKTEIDTFCGNVLPLQLLAEEDISRKPIVWKVQGDAVSIRDFADGEEFPFGNGILITALKEGRAEVCAQLEGCRYVCQVRVSAPKTDSKSGKWNYYVGDLHIHTTLEHDHDQFAARTECFPCDVIRQISEEGVLDFSVVSDHGDTLNDRDFFRGFVEDEEVSHENLVVFPGAESEVTSIEYDRYGHTHKNSGEIVTLNANNYAGVETWQEFYDKFADSPFGFAILAHPHVVGYDKNGIWNFFLEKNNTPELKKLVRLVEMGKGTPGDSAIIYEHYYSVALDCGFKVAPCCDTDSHARYEMAPAKTFIMASGKSKELFLDAVQNNRVYASESGLVELDFTVNGCGAGETMPLVSQYQFHVGIALRQCDPAAMPVKCEVISDYGVKLKTLEVKAGSSLDFEILSDSARYFYIRLVDGRGLKTWSAPIWTGRAFDDPAEKLSLTPLDKSEFTAWDEVSGQDAGVLINDDPWMDYNSSHQTASILIDMKKEYEICALSHITPAVFRDKMRELGLSICDKISGFACDYIISVSSDGNNFKECLKGSVREFGGEDIFMFPDVRARYVKFEVLNTVGKASELPQFADACLSMAEISVWKK